MDRIELKTVLYNAVDGFTRDQVVERLTEFRQECGEMLLQDAPIALVLRDVTDILGLSEDEAGQVLGPEVFEAVREWEHSRLWQASENGKAAILNGAALL